MITPEAAAEFRQIVLQYYGQYGRHVLPWRTCTEPYFIVVSELMLQQTQVARVVPKFQQFIHQFPHFEALAAAPLADVLGAWLGLGYNRRARFLHMLAGQVMQRHGGILPPDRQALEALPGIGPNTAGAILAYAFNQPTIFVETNIRTVYIHHFLPKRSDVDDTEIIALLAATADTSHPRQWYWALMDYGTYLKASAGNNIQRSRHYVKQSRFKGSLRQLRGAVLRQLQKKPCNFEQLHHAMPDQRLQSVLRALQGEGFIEQHKGIFCLTGARKLP